MINNVGNALLLTSVLFTGVKLMKNQTDSSSPFQEDEEASDELKDNLTK